MRKVWSFVGPLPKLNDLEVGTSSYVSVLCTFIVMLQLYHETYLAKLVGRAATCMIPRSPRVEKKCLSPLSVHPYIHLLDTKRKNIFPTLVGVPRTMCMYERVSESWVSAVSVPGGGGDQSIQGRPSPPASRNQQYVHIFKPSAVLFIFYFLEKSPFHQLQLLLLCCSRAAVLFF